MRRLSTEASHLFIERAKMVGILKTEDFNEQVYRSEKPVVIDFWSTWCRPCLEMSAAFRKVSKEIQSINFYKINVDENESIIKQFGIKSVPTLILFYKEKELRRVTGQLSDHEIYDWLNKNVNVEANSQQ